MPKRGKRVGSISQVKSGGRTKKSTTAYLHPLSSSYAPPWPKNKNSTTEQPQDKDQVPKKKSKVSNLVRTNKRLKKTNTNLICGKQEAETRVAASQANNAETTKVSNAQIKLLGEQNAAFLVREKDTEKKLQKKMDDKEIQSKSILGDSGKRAAEVLEKERDKL